MAHVPWPTADSHSWPRAREPVAQSRCGAQLAGGRARETPTGDGLIGLAGPHCSDRAVEREGEGCYCTWMYSGAGQRRKIASRVVAGLSFFAFENCFQPVN